MLNVPEMAFGGSSFCRQIVKAHASALTQQGEKGAVEEFWFGEWGQAKSSRLSKIHLPHGIAKPSHADQHRVYRFLEPKFYETLL